MCVSTFCFFFKFCLCVQKKIINVKISLIVLLQKKILNRYVLSLVLSFQFIIVSFFFFFIFKIKNQSKSQESNQRIKSFSNLQSVFSRSIYFKTKTSGVTVEICYVTNIS
jgi:hypothetical protein